MVEGGSRESLRPVRLFLRKSICMDATIVVFSLRTSLSHSLNDDGRCVLHIPHLEKCSIKPSQSLKAQLAHRHIERRKDMIGDRNCSFIQPLVLYLSTYSTDCMIRFQLSSPPSPARRMVCDKMRLSRRIAEREGSEAYDIIEDTHHPPSSDQLPRQGERQH